MNHTAYKYSPDNPLQGLSPALASLHGSLNAISNLWLEEIPPNRDVQARFGNPSFRIWYSDRLVKRSYSIVNCILECYDEYKEVSLKDVSMDILKECSKKGYKCAANEPIGIEQQQQQDEENENHAVIIELCAYLHSSFGHPIRLDYGTGHESSFLVFLFSLFKIKCLDNGTTKDKESQCIQFAATAISITHQYLEITRGLQLHYMLEPAGSHGVWGLDDYHCLPFFFGACQLINNEYGYMPSSIHDDMLLEEQEGKRFLYFGCIKFIKSLKRGVPFFESSPMLNDISSLPSWNKVSQGLIRLYEGEVLDKLPVVQHFVFGDIFKATWTPSDVCSSNSGRTAAFISANNDIHSVMPPTRAPWAK